VTERARHAGAAALLVLSTLAQTWPLARHLSTSLPGSGPGDNVTFVWNLWWMRHVGANPARFFHTDYVLWPLGANLVLHTHTLINGLIAATALRGLTLIEAQNVLVLASVFLNAVSAYWLAYRLTRSHAGALLAASIFSGAPYFAAHLEGHFNLLFGWAIPLWILLVRQAVRAQRTWDGVLAAAALALILYADYYYFIFALGAAVCLVAVNLWRLHLDLESRNASRPEPALKALRTSLGIVLALLLSVVGWIHFTGGATIRVIGLTLSLRSTFNPRLTVWVIVAALGLLNWRVRFRLDRLESVHVPFPYGPLAIGAVTFVVAALPLLVAAVSVIRSGEYVAPASNFKSAARGIDLAAFVTGNPRHPLVGQHVRRLNDHLDIDPIEGMGWLGIVPAAFAWLGLRRWPDHVDRRTWRLILCVFLIWSLGPFLTVCGWNTALILPQTALRYVPLASNARIPGRAMVMVYLSLAMLAAMGLASRPSRSRWLGWTVIALGVFDYTSAPIHLWQVEVPPIYAALRARPAQGALLELPMWIRDGFGNRGTIDPGSPLFQTVHEHPVVGGFVARIPPRVLTLYLEDGLFGPLLRASDPASRDTALPPQDLFRAALRARGIRYVLLRRSVVPVSMLNLVDHSLGPFLVTRDGERELFEVPDN
jgi:hypothetical protein